MNFEISDMYLQSEKDFQESPSKCLRYHVDSDNLELAFFLYNHGYFFADRTIKATISLKNISDLQKFCRMPLEKLDEPTDRIYEIAIDSFELDSRFFSKFPPNQEDRIELIRRFVDDMKSFYVCRYKEEIAGFIELVDTVENKSAEIRFAAVDKKYRLSGAAMSLYAGALTLYKEKGYQKILGRISARNTAVMNIYSTFGASFSEPKDVYIKR